ncbi:MAG: O-antigen ligase family protein [Victivallales bacterium]|nr:O-antigen ligase family protein [Victivallales bacterium]
MNSALQRQRAVRVLGISSVALTFLLPLKFGMIAGTPEVAFAIPDTLQTLLIFSWPPALFSFMSALLLLLVCLFCPPAGMVGKDANTMHLAFSWVLLFFSAIFGVLNASVADFVLIQLVLFSGLAAYALALMRLLKELPELKPWLVNAIIASTLLSALMGLSQFLGGFDATLQYVYAQEQETGLTLSEGMRSRLEETRIFSTFSICNSWAAHLVLTIPLCLWGIAADKNSFKTSVTVFSAYGLFSVMYANPSPAVFFLAVFILLLVDAMVLFKFNENAFKRSIPFMLLAAAGILLFNLRYTNSRGGMTAFAFSLIFLVFLVPMRPKVRICLSVLVALAVSPALFSDIVHRSLASMVVRLDYFLAAAKMFAAHPFAGTGWGDFFHEYTTIKQFPGTEAPHTPHNFVLSFASQAGIFGLLAAVLVILLPFRQYFQTRKTEGHNWLNTVLITGWCAWTMHSMVDFNIQACGTVATGIAMLLLLASPDAVAGLAAPLGNVRNATSRQACLVWHLTSIPLGLATIGMSLQMLYAEIPYSELHTMCNQGPAGLKAKPVADFDIIERQIRATSRRMPYSPFPWISAGNAAQAAGEFARSEIFYAEAIKRSPERASLYHRIFVSQMHLGKREKALENLRKAAELFPNAYAEQYEKMKDSN